MIDVGAQVNVLSAYSSTSRINGTLNIKCARIKSIRRSAPSISLNCVHGDSEPRTKIADTYSVTMER